MLKYRPEYPNNGFKTIDDARKWTKEFVDWYNDSHLHSGIQFVSPAACHEGRHLAILEKRKQVYEDAKKRHPERWSKGVRNWTPHQSVALNPLKETESLQKHNLSRLSNNHRHPTKGRFCFLIGRK